MNHLHQPIIISTVEIGTLKLTEVKQQSVTGKDWLISQFVVLNSAFNAPDFISNKRKLFLFSWAQGSLGTLLVSAGIKTAKKSFTCYVFIKSSAMLVNMLTKLEMISCHQKIHLSLVICSSRLKVLFSWYQEECLRFAQQRPGYPENLCTIVEIHDFGCNHTRNKGIWLLNTLEK